MRLTTTTKTKANSSTFSKRQWWKQTLAFALLIAVWIFGAHLMPLQAQLAFQEEAQVKTQVIVPDTVLVVSG